MNEQKNLHLQIGNSFQNVIQHDKEHFYVIMYYRASDIQSVCAKK